MEGRDEADARRLADAVVHRRAVLGYAMDALPSGPGEMTLRRIEHADTDSDYHPKTLVKLDRSLGWKPGTSLRILDGAAPPEGDERGESETSPPTSRLRGLLLDAGVGTRWTLAQLERKSRGRLSAGDWQRMLDEVLAWPPETMIFAADTLQRLGASVTAEQLERAMQTDLRRVASNPQPVPGDVLSEWTALVHRMTTVEREKASGVLFRQMTKTEMQQAVQELARLLAADLPTDSPAIPRAPA